MTAKNTQVKYVGRHRGGVTLRPDPEVDAYIDVAYGETVDLPTGTANSLLEQVDEWTAPTRKTSAKKRPAKKSAPAPAEADTPTPADGSPQED